MAVPEWSGSHSTPMHFSDIAGGAHDFTNEATGKVEIGCFAWLLAVLPPPG
jgi:hypothetical protein